MAGKAGKYGRLSINGAAFCVQKLNPVFTAGEIDMSCFETAPFEDAEAGLLKAVLDMEGYYDPAASPFATAPNLKPGVTLANVKVQHRAIGANWPFTPGAATDILSMASALVLRAATPIDVAGRIDFSCTIRNKGEFVLT